MTFLIAGFSNKFMDKDGDLNLIEEGKRARG